VKERNCRRGEGGGDVVVWYGMLCTRAGRGERRGGWRLVRARLAHQLGTGGDQGSQAREGPVHVRRRVCEPCAVTMDVDVNADGVWAA
jgi:hypothetical protein